MNYNQCKFCDFSMFIDKWGERKILGCKHEPYKGKWIAEIKECPKKGEKLCKQDLPGRINYIDMKTLDIVLKREWYDRKVTDVNVESKPIWDFKIK